MSHNGQLQRQPDKTVLLNREVQVLLTHEQYLEAVKQLLETDTADELSNVAICGAMLDLTSVCNGRCLHCIDSSSVNQPHLPAELPWPMLRGIVEDLHRMGCRFLEPMGGEPMLHSAYAPFVSLCVKLGIALKVVSNGTMAHRYLEPLQEAASVPGTTIRFSLNGDERTYPMINRAQGSEDDYRLVLNSIRALARWNLRVTVSYVVFPENRHTIARAARAAREAGAVRFLVLPGRDPITKNVIIQEDRRLKWELLRTRALHGEDFDVQLPGTLEESLRVQFKTYQRCYHAFLKPAIGVDGTLYPCSYLKQRPDLSLGRVRPDCGLQAVWTSETRVQRLLRVRPDRLCQNITCTRHHMNQFIDQAPRGALASLYLERARYHQHELFF